MDADSTAVGVGDHAIDCCSHSYAASQQPKPVPERALAGGLALAPGPELVRVHEQRGPVTGYAHASGSWWDVQVKVEGEGGAAGC